MKTPPPAPLKYWLGYPNFLYPHVTSAWMSSSDWATCWGRSSKDKNFYGEKLAGNILQRRPFKDEIFQVFLMEIRSISGPNISTTIVRIWCRNALTWTWKYHAPLMDPYRLLFQIQCNLGMWAVGLKLKHFLSGLRHVVSKIISIDYWPCGTSVTQNLKIPSAIWRRRVNSTAINFVVFS